MQVYLEAGGVVTLYHHGALGVHNGGARKAAPDGLKHQLWVHAGHLGQGEGLGHGLDITGHYNLVCKLGGVARAHLATAHHRGAHGQEHRLELIKHLLLAANHKA